MKITRRRFLTVLAGAAAAIGVPSAWMSRMKTYDGPISDHFDGLNFFDPDGVPPKSLGEVLRWQFGSGRQRAEWPEWVPSPFADTPPPRVYGGKVRLSFVGHASWLIQTSGLNILIDPVWSARVSPVSFAGPKRHNDPGIAFDALPDIDVVLVSHGHYDHLDLATLSRLAAKFAPRVVTPLGNDVTMRSADAALVGARPVRPQQGAVGQLRARDAGRQDLHRLRFRLWRGHAFPQGCREAWPAAAGDPADRRL
jgi:glyoxylase-like metal-dependent hydrolase (beta-lactamase superfamily II)